MIELQETSAYLPQGLNRFKVLALYKFADFKDCAALKPGLALFCCARKIRGTFILAPEGINGTVAGSPEAIDELMAWFEHDPLWRGRLAGAEAKFSGAAEMPFLRMKVRLKPEIVTLRAPEADPGKAVGTYVEPADWNGLIGRNDVTLIDTRNDYEVALGSFADARDPKTQSFAEFKAYAATLDPARHPKIAMFCTGGIRCEKASSYLMSRGFKEVFHLKGGILKYLETVPAAESRFTGECFVFDERVSVTHGLKEGEAVLCRACRLPVMPANAVGALCRTCAEATPPGAVERERQMELARARGDAHLGDDAAETAARNRATKLTRRKQSKDQSK
ncbi:MAG: rhodanese protein [Devosia sp.]|uniref:oxygen-dependent tRNA uridine(34) hydroxylase TrhO n=1 Tax=Devosia sp. TaxID=1871048 RepID=UPI00261B3F5C|nr:rhodanese-related sulfurtransferase [Devosia sp.]MDB5539847.1 rhodanese protein [Devosia sp.]